MDVPDDGAAILANLFSSYVNNKQPTCRKVQCLEQGGLQRLRHGPRRHRHQGRARLPDPLQLQQRGLLHPDPERLLLQDFGRGRQERPRAGLHIGEGVWWCR